MSLKTIPVVFFFVVSVFSLQNNYCQLSCDYGVKPIPHTVCERESEKCGPHPNCGPDFRILGLTDGIRQYILDIHNYLRNKVAMGHEKRGEQPPASNMNIMNYNKELEFIAQCWSNTCNGNPLNHDICRRTVHYEHVGQNLGFINSSKADFDLPKAVKELILLWFDEVEIYNNEWVNNTQDRGPKFKVGHYTQMMWADTKEVGCAVTYYTTMRFDKKWHHIVFVCNYGPGGNYLSLPVYAIGKPCSKCPNGLSQNRKYRGLCGNTTKVKDVKDSLKSKHKIFDLWYNKKNDVSSE